MITEALTQEKFPAESQGTSGTRGPRIGKVALEGPVILAPMAGITDRPFRRLCREMGASLAVTEMVSAQGLARGRGASREIARGFLGEEPWWVQLFGEDPGSMARAAKIVEGMGAGGIDINLGCPVAKVVKTGAGAALLKEPARSAALVRAVRRAVKVPVTVKMRAGWDGGSINCLEVAKAAQEEGADGVILHPRTARQFFKGSADWSLIKGLKDNLTVPVIGNGDVASPKDALKMLDETGCDGVMVARAARGAPWIFRDILVYLERGEAPKPPAPKERLRVMLKHLELLGEEYGARLAMKRARMHFMWYVKGLRGGARFRSRISGVSDMGELGRIAEDFLLGLEEATR